MTAIMDMERGVFAPRWVKIAAGIGAVWYAFGCLQFWLAVSVDTATAVQTGAMTQAHAAAVEATPAAVWASFALASFLGLVGAVLLLRGSPKAVLAFGASLVSAGIYYGWIYVLSGTGAERPGEEIVIAVVVLVVTAGFFGLSRKVG